MDPHPTASEREQRAATDSRPESTEVLTHRRSAANGGYAYHRIADDGTPVCGGERRLISRILNK